MKIIDRLAADADQKDKAASAYERDFVKVTELRGCRMYKKGFKAARAFASLTFKESRAKYSGMIFEEAFARIEADLESLGEEEESS